MSLGVDRIVGLGPIEGQPKNALRRILGSWSLLKVLSWLSPARERFRRSASLDGGRAARLQSEWLVLAQSGR
jgi:hypothetical protein